MVHTKTVNSATGALAIMLADFHITRRESEVASMVAQGMTSKQIAAHMTISPRTVQTYITALNRKFLTANRTQLAVKYLEYLKRKQS